MSSRIGICQQCGQRFGDLPDTLTATKVKCPECGGVVDIPPVAEASSAEEPAKPASPAAGGGPVARPLGDAKKKERPSEARSVDRDVATPAPKPPAAKPVVPPKPVAKKPVVPPKPVAKKPLVPPKPVAKKPAAPAPKPPAKKPAPAAAKPAAGAPAARKPSAADILAKAKAKRAAESGAASAERKPTAAEILAKAKAKRAAESAGKATAAAGASKGRPSGQGPVRGVPSGPPAGGRRRPPAGAAPRGGAARSRRREREEEVEYEESGPNGVQIASGIVLVLALAGGAWWMLRPTDEAAPTDTTVVTPTPTSSGVGTTGQGIDPNAGDSTAGGASESSSGAGSPDAGANPEPGAGDSGGGGETPDPAEASAEAAPKPTPSSGAPSVWSTPEDPMASIEWRNFEDPAAMLLSEVPPLPRHASTSDEVWAEVQEDLALFVADSGVMSTRAGDRLIADHGRDAFPAVINAAMAVDWDGDGGSRAAGMLVNLLDRKWVKSGSRFGWTEPALYEKGSDDWKEAMVTAKSVVLRWRNYWVQTLGVTDAGWENFSGEKVSAGSGGDGGGVVAPPDPFD